MVQGKNMLSLEQIDAQSALELPDRDMMSLVTVVIGSVRITVDADVAAAICAQVLSAGNQTCRVIG